MKERHRFETFIKNEEANNEIIEKKEQKFELLRKKEEML